MTDTNHKEATMADADTKLITLALSPRLARMVQFCIEREIECAEVPEAAETALTAVLDEIDQQAGNEPPFDIEDEEAFNLPGISRVGSLYPADVHPLDDGAARIANRMAQASRAAVEGA